VHLWSNGETNQLSFEVDFDIFVSKFYARFERQIPSHKRNKLSETMIWTEIFSVIKGGMKAADDYKGFLPLDVYMRSEGSKVLSANEKFTIYWIFCEYEKWKDHSNAFDLMDLVQHLLSSTKVVFGYKEITIDYLMIDEV